MAKELLTREEVAVENTWALSDLYEDAKAWEADLNKAVSVGEELAGMEGIVCASSANLLKTIKLMEQFCIIIDAVHTYAHCQSDQDTGNTDNLAMAAKVMSVYADIASKIAFIDPEILAMDEETLNKFYAEAPELTGYKHYINETMRMKAHTLSAEMEKLLAMSEETRDASSTTFGLLNNADMTFPAVKDEDGEDVTLSHGRFIGMLMSNNREVRKNTFEAYYGTYKKFLNTYASLYNGQIKGLIFGARARKYENTLEAAVFRNDVTSKVYHNLVNTVNDNVSALHDYVSLRKKLLGVDELHMYDVYVPMLPDFSKEVTFEEAKETALKALAPLGEDYLKVIKEGFDNRWIDVYENKGKRSGAYETAAYGHHPYVLLNYDNKLDDMFTLVHEMGHAMHSYYSDKALPYFESRYKIFVAEVASTCNELLLLEYLLKNTDDVNEKKYLLNHYLDMFKGTLFRQTQFAEFEMLTNKMVEEGENLNSKNLSDLYKKINEKYYGPDMISDEEISYEWARIPHFYYDFYVYQYATSFSASVAIVQKILTEGESAVAEYKKFLSSGCTKPPVELLKAVGVDLETDVPIKAAIDVMRKAIKDLEALL